VAIDDVKTLDKASEYDDNQVDSLDENYSDIDDGLIDINCPKCGEIITISSDDTGIKCPWCDSEINIK
jgi:hypothetical protein